MDSILRNAKALIATLAPLILAGINVYQDAAGKAVGADRWWLVAAGLAGALLVWATPNQPPAPVPAPMRPGGYPTDRAEL